MWEIAAQLRKKGEEMIEYLDDEFLEQLENPTNPIQWTKWAVLFPKHYAWICSPVSLETGVTVVGGINVFYAALTMGFYGVGGFAIWAKCHDESITAIVFAVLRSLLHASVSYMCFVTRYRDQDRVVAYRTIRKGVFFHVPLTIVSCISLVTTALLQIDGCDAHKPPEWLRPFYTAWILTVILENLLHFPVILINSFMLFSYFWRLKYFPTSLTSSDANSQIVQDLTAIYKPELFKRFNRIKWTPK